MQIIPSKVKVNVDLYSTLSWSHSTALRYCTRSQGISQIYLHTPRTSTNGMKHTCLCLPCRSWYSFPPIAENAPVRREQCSQVSIPFRVPCKCTYSFTLFKFYLLTICACLFPAKLVMAGWPTFCWTSVHHWSSYSSYSSSLDNSPTHALAVASPTSSAITSFSSRCSGTESRLTTCTGCSSKSSSLENSRTSSSKPLSSPGVGNCT